MEKNILVPVSSIASIYTLFTYLQVYNIDGSFFKYDLMIILLTFTSLYLPIVGGKLIFQSNIDKNYFISEKLTKFYTPIAYIVIAWAILAVLSILNISNLAG